jgi:hypothetical protein
LRRRCSARFQHALDAEHWRRGAHGPVGGAARDDDRAGAAGSAHRRLVKPPRRLGATALSLAALVAAGAVACARSERPPGDGAAAHPAPAGSTTQPPDPLAPLRTFEASKRASTDFAHAPSSGERFGPDPYAIRALPGTDGYVGVLRGRAAVVQLDVALKEIGRIPAPESPSSIDVTPTGDVWVAGELSTRIARYRVRAGALETAGDVETGLTAIRGVAAGPEGVLHVVDERTGSLLTISPATGKKSLLVPCRRGAAMRVARTARHLVVDCLLDHAIVAYGVDAAGMPRVDTESRATQDGPLWGIDAVEAGDDLVVAAGGVEDHPLDRTGGFFGWIDSYVFLYRQPRGKGALERTAAVNVSEHGVVTPKALLLGDRAREVTVTGYGGDHMAIIRESGDVVARPMAPGIAAVARRAGGAGGAAGLVAADPLLDAFLLVDDAGWSAAPVSDPDAARSDDSRVGEALLFTTLMAPWDGTEGPLSRFTCETCHFEQYVDGRTHHTGRGEVHATTKPLIGLFNNRPHFSRALDPDLTSVANNEFRVAGAHSGADPWFSISTSEIPWLGALHLGTASLSPIDLRRAFMTYLMESSPRPNPAVVLHAGGARFADEERAGAAAFRDRCASCHAARIVEDDQATEVPFDRWEALVMSREGPVVWGSPEYRKTGVEPYVNDLGCRTPSLRRLYKKRPYLTNGSAETLAAVLDHVRIGSDGTFLHDGNAGTPLDDDTKKALLAFLDLL